MSHYDDIKLTSARQCYAWDKLWSEGDRECNGNKLQKPRKYKDWKTWWSNKYNENFDEYVKSIQENNL